MKSGDGDYVLPVDKPVGPTSHDVVAMARRALGTRRIGHTGTLDPFASGLLVLCVGRATRLAEYLTGLDKTYVAEARLGIATDTLDREGVVVATDTNWEAVDSAAVEGCLSTFVGPQEQVPPQYSAKKVDGEAMHRKARRGESVDLAPVPVEVYSLELLRFEPPHVTFSVHCSSGTYVRALARDIGHTLGVGAHLTALRRTRVGSFCVDGAVAVEDLENHGAVVAARCAPLTALSHLAVLSVDEAEAVRIRHGQRLRVQARTGGGADSPRSPVDQGTGPGVRSGDALVAVARAGDLVAIARIDDGVLKPTKVFPE